MSATFLWNLGVGKRKVSGNWGAFTLKSPR